MPRPLSERFVLGLDRADESKDGRILGIPLNLSKHTGSVSTTWIKSLG